MSPKGSKFRKDRKGRKGKIPSITYSGYSLDKGEFALKALSAGRVTAAQLEAIRVVIRRTLKKQGKIFFRVFPFKSITQKPAEVRMGSGKGNPEYWTALVEPGRILFELDGISEEIAKEACRQAAFKVSITTKFVRRLI